MTVVLAAPVSALVPALAGVLAAAALAGGGSSPPAPLDLRPSTPAPARADAAQGTAGGAWPLAPRPDVVAPFAPPEVAWAAGHRGVDLAGSPGQTVRSTLPGVVTYAGLLAGRGVVVVDHGAIRTTYQPVSAAVAVGDQVGRATALGVVEAPAGTACLRPACTGGRSGATSTSTR